MANVSLPFYKKIEVKSLQCVCYIYGYVLNTQCWELNLVQKLIILGIEHSTNKVGIIFSNYKQFLKNKKSCYRLEKKIPFYFVPLSSEAMISFKPKNITRLKITKCEPSIFVFVCLFVCNKKQTPSSLI